jgi:hypothetical protein
LQDHAPSQPGRTASTCSLPWEPTTLHGPYKMSMLAYEQRTVGKLDGKGSRVWNVIRIIIVYGLTIKYMFILLNYVEKQNVSFIFLSNVCGKHV